MTDTPTPEQVAEATGPQQLTDSDLATMSAEQIVEAKQSGQLDTMLGIQR